MALNIATDQAVDQIDYAPLRAQFALGGQSVRRQFEWVNGQARRQTVFSVGLRPRGPGTWTVPALRVGHASTAPLQLVVRAPTVQPATPDSDVFVETTVDAEHPYVQQTVGVIVRLNYAIPLLSGELDLDPPAGASLQRVGEDISYQRMLGGRRYQVLERRYLLVPERSGPLLLPGARLTAIRGPGFAGPLFEDDRTPVSAAAPARLLQVRPIPAEAPSPWLPLHALRLRYLRAPTQAFAGAAAMVEVALEADGATAAQAPALEWPAAPGVQVFPEPAQVQERFVDGRPQVSVRRVFALVPQQPGALSLPGPQLAWWDADAGRAQRSILPPLRLQVAPGTPAATAPAAGGAMSTAASAVAPASPPAAAPQVPARPAISRGAGDVLALWLWGGVLALALLAAGVAGVRRWRARRAHGPAPAAEAPALPVALASGDLAAIARALTGAAGCTGEDLDAVAARLQDPAQVEAVRALQAARWGGGAPEAALRALRPAFAAGPRWRAVARATADPLPPLYPESR
ncbi:BatD family protein [Thermomonas sp. S9]|uniref:BatD family protein n=1 Tax=Thermomonas sp. S9 TaxID=2885203 RepID=UPI00216B23DC|nr:BatD family protein [Thermomonas sp. S9]MCR6497315.1 BatD family protein [Thermomonas sp. S9]